MIGQVEKLHALLPVPFRLTGQPSLSLDFVIDTGFTGELTLPPVAVAALGLPFIYDESVNLANDTDAIVAVHSATILWQDVERDVRVFATGQRPLLVSNELDCAQIARNLPFLVLALPG